MIQEFTILPRRDIKGAHLVGVRDRTVPGRAVLHDRCVWRVATVSHGDEFEALETGPEVEDIAPGPAGRHQHGRQRQNRNRPRLRLHVLPFPSRYGSMLRRLGPLSTTKYDKS